MLLCGNNLQLVASETDNVSAGNNRESGNKRLGTGGKPWRKSDKNLGGKNDQECMSKLDGYFMK